MGKEYSPFKMKSSPAKFYQELEMFRKAAMGATRFAGATAAAIPAALYSFYKEGKKRGFKPPEKLAKGEFKTPTNQPVVASGGDPTFTTRKVERATSKGFDFNKKKTTKPKKNKGFNF